MVCSVSKPWRVNKGGIYAGSVEWTLGRHACSVCAAVELAMMGTGECGGDKRQKNVTLYALLFFKLWTAIALMAPVNLVWFGLQSPIRIRQKEP